MERARTRIRRNIFQDEDGTVDRTGAVATSSSSSLLLLGGVGSSSPRGSSPTSRNNKTSSWCFRNVSNALLVSLFWLCFSVAQQQNAQHQPSILDQLLQSLVSKLRGTGNEQEQVEAALLQHQQQEQQQRQMLQNQAQRITLATLPPPHHHTSKNPGPVADNVLPQHLRRLSLYQQHGLYNHYASLVENQTAFSAFGSLVQQVYDTYQYGYAAEPPIALPMSENGRNDKAPLQQDEEKDSSSSRTFSLVMDNYNAFPPFPPSKRQANLELLQEMFQKGYDAYMYNAWLDLPPGSLPSGEVAPLTCRPKEFSLVKVPALTVFDALDTLLILGNTTEFARAVERLRQLHTLTKTGLFDLDQNVSLFETNIRILGGLLSAHQMAEAWLPEVLILKQDVFLSHDETLSAGSAQVRTGRDDVTTGFCHVAPLSGNSDGSSNVNKNMDLEFPPSVASCNTRLCPSTSSIGGDSDCIISHGTAPWRNRFSSSSPTVAWKNATQTKLKLPPDAVWSYDGLLLDMALDLGERLLPAFRTLTGIPYGTVNLQSGIPPGETAVASLAGAGTLVLEMDLLSRLVPSKPIFGQVAKRAARALWLRQSHIYLLGKHINVQTGAWTESLSGIGSNSDSFAEYLAKQFFLFGGRSYYKLDLVNDEPFIAMDNDFWIMFVSVYSGVYLELRRGDWYVDADMMAGSKAVGRRLLEALMAFYPGLQVMAGEFVPAARSLNGFFMAREYLGFLPERFQFEQWKVDSGAGAGKHPLRPELLESSYLLHRAYLGTTAQGSLASLSSGWLWASDFALHQLAKLTPAPCGYASLSDVRTHITGTITTSRDNVAGGSHIVKRYDEMPSFFLTETIKYLYLTFDDNDKLHQDSLNRNWIFTTEAHPIHVPATHEKELDGDEEDIQLLEQLLKQRIRGKKHVDLVKARPPGETRDPHAQANEMLFSAAQTAEYRKILYHVKDQAGNRSTELLRRSREDFFHYGNLIQPAPAVRAAYKQQATSDILHDFDYENINEAQLQWTQLGLQVGWNLIKACPNVYNSDLLWMMCLHGGAIDYVPRFVSILHDSMLANLQVQNEPVYVLSQALGQYGSWRPDYASSLQPSSFCYVEFGERGKARVTKTRPGSSRHQSSPPSENEQPMEPEGFTHIQTEMGNFQVKAFDGGGGFGVNHVETGQVLTATFVRDHFIVGDPTPPRTFVMVHAVFPPEEDLSRPKTGSPDKTGSTASQPAASQRVVEEDQLRSVERVVMMTDTHGNSFSCDVELVNKKVDTNEEINVVFRVPCTPAMFGPTHMVNLVAKGDLVLEGYIFAPDSENLFGCDSSSSSSNDLNLDQVGDAGNHVVDGETTCANRSIHLVHRGECSFIAKATNMKLGQNADGVIVINTDDEEVFIMSYGGDDVRGMREDLPVTVLISGADGGDILEVMSLFQKITIDGSYLSSRIVLKKQQYDGSEPKNSSTNGEVRFPLVRASENSLRIFSKGGWGIHAMHQVENGQSSWHLQLMRHRLDGGAEEDKDSDEDGEGDDDGEEDDDDDGDKHDETVSGVEQKSDKGVLHLIQENGDDLAKSEVDTPEA